jgi:prolyl-tRNA editing enzyme YbaK/EbsC (Cys-tRNA(Pro) deacylase)
LEQQDAYTTGLTRRYDWKPVSAAVRRWVRDRGCGCMELRVDTVDAEFGVKHFSPRAGTLLVNACYGSTERYFLLLKPAAVRADMRAVSRAIDSDSARIASQAEVQAATQCRPGCLPPIGDVFDFPLLVDARLATATELFVPSGQPGFAILVRTRDILRMDAVRVIGEQSRGVSRPSDEARVV